MSDTCADCEYRIELESGDYESHGPVWLCPLHLDLQAEVTRLTAKLLEIQPTANKYASLLDDYTSLKTKLGEEMQFHRQAANERHHWKTLWDKTTEKLAEVEAERDRWRSEWETTKATRRLGECSR